MLNLHSSLFTRYNLYTVFQYNIKTPKSLFQNPLARRKKFVAIRNEARQGRRGDGDDDEVAGSTSSVHYLASQYLADSSLSTDVSQFDFSSTVHSTVSIC